MSRQAAIVEIVMRVQVEAGSTFDHESVTELTYRMFECAQAANVLEDADGAITKLILVSSEFHDAEEEDGYTELTFEGTKYFFNVDSICVEDEELGSEFLMFHKLVNPTVSDITNLLANLKGSTK
jgi:hypothetical protein